MGAKSRAPAAAPALEERASPSPIPRASTMVSLLSKGPGPGPEHPAQDLLVPTEHRGSVRASKLPNVTQLAGDLTAH